MSDTTTSVGAEVTENTKELIQVINKMAIDELLGANKIIVTEIRNRRAERDAKASQVYDRDMEVEFQDKSGAWRRGKVLSKSAKGLRILATDDDSIWVVSYGKLREIVPEMVEEESQTNGS